MDYLRDMIEKALGRDLRTSALTDLEQQIKTTAKHHAPNLDTVLRAVELGDGGVVRALLGSDKLSEVERKQMATTALLAWSNNPLASRQPEALFAALVEQGADLSAKVGRNPSIAELVGERLGRIEGNERRMKVAGKLKFSTAPCKILTQCWAAMEASGANLDDARRVREKSGRLVNTGVAHVKPQPGAGAFPGTGRMGPARM